MTDQICKLAVIVINYKTPRLVIDCLESLLPELIEIDSKVVIVDNASKDDSCMRIQNWINDKDVLDNVKLIASDENTGFSGGNNLGITHIDALNYLLLNSDTLVRKGAISILLDAAEKNKEAGLISPRLEWLDGTPQESCFKFHTPVSELISSSATKQISQLFSSFIVAQPVCEHAGFYEWTSFACVLVKADVFKNIGLMDEGYFMYFEDVMFSYNAQQAGWKVLNVPEAHVVHLRGGSSPVKSQAKQRKRLPRYYYESRTRMFYQLYGYFGLFIANVLWMLGWTIASFRQLISSRFIPKHSALQWSDLWINFFNPLKNYIHPDNYDKT